MTQRQPTRHSPVVATALAALALAAPVSAASLDALEQPPAAASTATQAPLDQPWKSGNSLFADGDVISTDSISGLVIGPSSFAPTEDAKAPLPSVTFPR